MALPYLVTGRWLVSSAQDVRSDAGVVVAGQRVLDVGTTARLSASYPDLEVIGGEDAAVLPGFVNAHHHCYGVPLANHGTADDFLEPWMFANLGHRSLPQEMATAFSAAQMIRSGVTAVVDMCSAGDSAESLERSVGAKASAYRKVGMRAAIAPGERWKNRVVLSEGKEQQFLSMLPAELRRRFLNVQSRRRRLSPDDYVATIERLAAEYDGDSLVSVWYGPTAPHWTLDDTLRRIAAVSLQSGVRVQTHALESYYESLESLGPNGHGVLQDLEALGLLGPRLSLAHMVWTPQEDMERIALSGAQICCNPSSNLRLRSGISPASQFKDYGIPMALGMDGTSLADDDDMFAEMRLMLNLARSPDQRAPYLTPGDVFEAATQSGAKVLGMEAEVGRLEPGAYADIVVIDINHVTRPWLDPDVDPLSLILAKATARDVRHVVVDGEFRLRDGVVLGLDVDKLHDEMSEAMNESDGRQEERAVAAELRPHLLKWYAKREVELAATHQDGCRIYDSNVSRMAS